MAEAPSMDIFVSLCKRRGFVFQSSEIYGGIGGFWDYGPLGVELKNNIKRDWWRAVVQERDDVVGIETAIIMNPRVWQASGHVDTFADPMVDCKSCKRRFRADELVERKHEPESVHGHAVDTTGVRCPECGGELTEPRMCNLIFRDREFEQMEMEFFVMPGTDEEWHDVWIEERFNWWTGLGVRKEHLHIREHTNEELSHYSKRTVDIEYDFPFAGFAEIEGIANRTDFDLKRPEDFPGPSLKYFDEQSGQHVVPYVIEPAMGIDRCFLTVLIDAYAEEEVRGEKRTPRRLHKRLAPIKAAILPLSRNEQLAPPARRVWDLLRPHFMTQYDDAQSIGRRSRPPLLRLRPPVRPPRPLLRGVPQATPRPRSPRPPGDGPVATAGGPLSSRPRPLRRRLGPLPRAARLP